MAEKLAPHDIEAEQAVLGSILVDPDCFLDVRAIITAQDFYDDRNQRVFGAMDAIREGIDQITIADELAHRGQLEEIGGVAYLSRVVSIIPTSVHAEYYARMVKRKAFQRHLISAAGQIAAAAYNGASDNMELFAKAHQILANLQPRDGSVIVDPPHHAQRLIEMLGCRVEREQPGLTFGYRDLDGSIGGMYAGNLVIIGARPYMGKTQLLQEIALHNVIQGHTVLMATAEQTLEEFDERHVAMETGVDIRRFRKGDITDLEIGAIRDLAAHVGELPLYFLEGSMTVENIAQQAKLMQSMHGLDLLLVDYIQLLRDRVDRKAGDTLRERIGYVSNGLKNIARDLGIPVVAASQLRRDVEGRADKRPTLADLKESGDLEQDADIVILLHRPEVYDAGKEAGILYIYVVKVRQLGIVATVELVWWKSRHRYMDKVRDGIEGQEALTF